VDFVGSAIWLILREAASRGPSAIADILVRFIEIRKFREFCNIHNIEFSIYGWGNIVSLLNSEGDTYFTLLNGRAVGSYYYYYA